MDVENAIIIPSTTVEVDCKMTLNGKPTAYYIKVKPIFNTNKIKMNRTGLKNILQFAHLLHHRLSVKPKYQQNALLHQTNRTLVASLLQMSSIYWKSFQNSI